MLKVKIPIMVMIPKMARADKKHPIFIQIPVYAFSFSIKNPNHNDSGENSYSS